jgi:hypothetical protein
VPKEANKKKPSNKMDANTADSNVVHQNKQASTMPGSGSNSLGGSVWRKSNMLMAKLARITPMAKQGKRRMIIHVLSA